MPDAFVTSLARQTRTVKVTRDDDGRTSLKDPDDNPVNWNHIAPHNVGIVWVISWFNDEYGEHILGLGWRDPNGAYIFTDTRIDLPEVVQITRAN